MKDWIVKKFKALFDKVKAYAAPKLEKASGPVKIVLIVGLLIAAVVAVIGLVAALIVFLFVLPGAFFGGLCWLVWTYFGLGAQYFPALDPLYLTIPFWHFVGAASVLVFFLKLLKGGSKAAAKAEPNVVNNFSRR